MNATPPPPILSPQVDHAKRTVALSLRGDEIRSVLAGREMEYEDRFEGACLHVWTDGHGSIRWSGGWVFRSMGMAGSIRPPWEDDFISVRFNKFTCGMYRVFTGCTWQPEFGAWMVESTPNGPYGAYAHDLLRYILLFLFFIYFLILNVTVKKDVQMNRHRVYVHYRGHQHSPFTHIHTCIHQPSHQFTYQHTRPHTKTPAGWRPTCASAARGS